MPTHSTPKKTRPLRRTLMPVVSFLLAAALAQPVAPPDACATLIPPALSSRIAGELPGYQLPQITDAGDARVRDIATQGDWPCPFVVAGDFDGNGSLDRALLLKGPNGVRLVGALNQQGQWRLSLSEEWPLPLTDSELLPLESGLYQRADAINQPVAQLDQLAGLQAEHAGFRAGKVNGRYAVYFLFETHWQKLTMKDE